MKAIDIRDKLKSTKIYEKLTGQLDSHKNKPIGSVCFLVDSDPSGDIKIFIKYPGRKIAKRPLKRINSNSVLWENLYDFFAVPYYLGKEVTEYKFTYKEMLDDFEKFKKNDEDFWGAILHLYEENKIIQKQFGAVGGMSPLLFLYTLKWLWIQEDLNYRFNHKPNKNEHSIKTPTYYTNKTTGVGRGKFFASLLLVKSGYFSAKDCIKITSLY